MKFKSFVHIDHINKICINMRPLFCKSIYELLPVYLQKPVVMDNRYTHNKSYCYKASSIQAFHGMPESMSWASHAPSVTGEKPACLVR